jgi:excinuclease ABC subunit A
MKLTHATGNNLKDVTLKLPVGLLSCITGVSGSGKSTLINDTLYRIVAHHYTAAALSPPRMAKWMVWNSLTR